MVGITACGCSGRPADLLLINGQVYTMDWPDPDQAGSPAEAAPYGPAGWHPDAEAIAIRGDRIIFVGTTERARGHQGAETVVRDLRGAVVIPGLVESHTHVMEMGANLNRIDLRGVGTEQEAIERVVAGARGLLPGQWVFGYGWDEGAWANRYPDLRRLSNAFPENPVYLRSLHGFAGWLNRAALEAVGITADTEPPVGGQILKLPDGSPSGIVLNNAVDLVDDAVPPASREQLKQNALAALNAMAEAGYVAVHEAGVAAATLSALEELEESGLLPIRFYAMLDGSDEELCLQWMARGPDRDTDSMLRTLSVKAFYDGALGSRGAKMLTSYSDMPGHQGVSGSDYGFDQTLMADMMKAGFQIAIHAIGDAGNRETLEFIESVIDEYPRARAGRHRIEHAQVVHPDDFLRFREAGVIASMEPPHAVEDMWWAEERVGSERILGAYAWRTMRVAGVHLVFNSDLPGSDHDIMYGLHSAITRRDKELRPEGGWYPNQNVTAEEAVRAYSTWAAWSSFVEDETGVIARGRWADLTVMDVDPLMLGSTRPEALLKGSILMTVVGGDIAFER
jgi:predicted amidohydrolase YtcJ